MLRHLKVNLVHYSVSRDDQPEWKFTAGQLMKVIVWFSYRVHRRLWVRALAPPVITPPAQRAGVKKAEKCWPE